MNIDFVKQIGKVKLAGNKYSQCGEELLLQFIFDNIGTTNRHFADIGAGDGYALSNVRRFADDGWTGLMLDADPRGSVDVMAEFITPENICELMRKYNTPKEFDLLSLDIDSCDFQILRSIVSEFRPRVVVAEYNTALLGSVYLKMEPGYTWDGTTKYGFSFDAGVKLMKQHGYSAVYHNNLNLFWIADEVLGGHQDFKLKHTQIFNHPTNHNVQWEQY